MSRCDEIIALSRKRERIVFDEWVKAGCPEKFIHSLELKKRLAKITVTAEEVQAVASEGTDSPPPVRHRARSAPQQPAPVVTGVDPAAHSSERTVKYTIDPAGQVNVISVEVPDGSVR